jgi:hypothetical protein
VKAVDLPDLPDAVAHFPGIMVRDYLIAHAPEHPQPWFSPKMPPCPELPDRNAIQDEALKQDIRTAFYHDTDPQTAAGEAWMKRYDNAKDAQREWKERQEREKYLQWPSAWADAQLRLRAAWMLEQGVLIQEKK